MESKELVNEIFRLYEFTQQGRLHLGASQIGEECERKLWYGFRWAKQYLIKGRIGRLFQRGHREEQWFIDDLTRIGFKIQSTQDVMSLYGGHFGGSCDGIATKDGSTYLLEFKTSNDKGFNDLTLKGVRRCKPIHYYQMQVYMRALDIKKAIYLVINKNTEDLHAEIIDYEYDDAKAMELKAQDIITSQVPLQKLSSSATFWKCKFCDYQDICHKNVQLDKNCRTCRYSRPDTSTGDWNCTKFSTILTEEKQRKGCDEWESLL